MTFVDPSHRALVAIDFKLEFGFKEVRHAVEHPLAGSL